MYFGKKECAQTKLHGNYYIIIIIIMSMMMMIVWLHSE